VVDLVLSPADNSTLYGATRYNGVFRTNDGGSSWVAAYAGLPRGIGAVAAAVDGTVYSAAEPGGEGGVFRSSDGGGSWEEVLAVQATAIAADPTAAGTIYVGTAEPRIFKTTDGGDTWTSSTSGLRSIIVRNLAVDPLTPMTLYLGSDDKGVFKSTNGGLSWTKKDQGIPDAEILSLVIDPVTPSTLYIASSEGLFKSQDGAENWSPAGEPPAFVTTLAIDPTTPSTILGGAFGRIFLSTDSGGNWSEAGTGVPGAEISVIAVDPASSSVLYAGTGSGVVKSEDGGANWTERNAGLRAVRVDRLAVDPASPGTVYAGSRESGIFKSTDGGSSWLGANEGIDNRRIQDLVPAPSQPQTLYAAQALGLRRSDDGGSLWMDPVTDPEDFGLRGPEVVSLAVDSLSAGTLFALNGGVRTPFGGGPAVLRSTTAAVTWEQVFVPSELAAVQAGTVAVDPEDPGEVVSSFSGRESGSPVHKVFIFRSSDGGATWEEVYQEPGTGSVPLVYDPLESTTLYAIRSPGESFEVLRSTDGGDSWAPLVVTAPCVNDLLPDPATAGTIWVGCDPVYFSEDGGTAWSMFDATGFPVGSGGALGLAFEPGSTPRLYAGTEIGVYSYSFPAPADLAISKEDGVSELNPGEPVTYTIGHRRQGDRCSADGSHLLLVLCAVRGGVLYRLAAGRRSGRARRSSRGHDRHLYRGLHGGSGGRRLSRQHRHRERSGEPGGSRPLQQLGRRHRCGAGDRTVWRLQRPLPDRRDLRRSRDGRGMQLDQRRTRGHRGGGRHLLGTRGPVVFRVQRSERGFHRDQREPVALSADSSRWPVRPRGLGA
jgi:photosystem II stability/assembly factor-like uncharacterized protein